MIVQFYLVRGSKVNSEGLISVKSIKNNLYNHIKNLKSAIYIVRITNSIGAKREVRCAEML